MRLLYSAFVRRYWKTTLTVIAWAIPTFMACWSANTAHDAMKHSEQVAATTIEPRLVPAARFSDKIHDGCILTLTNNGPMIAYQVELTVYIHQYSDRLNRIYMWGTGSNLKWQIDSLSVWQDTAIQLNAGILRCHMVADSLHYNVIEVRARYRRKPDLRQFIDRCFYFINPQVRFVSEHDNSLPSERYSNIISAVISTDPSIDYIVSERLPGVHRLGRE